MLSSYGDCETLREKLVQELEILEFIQLLQAIPRQ